MSDQVIHTRRGFLTAMAMIVVSAVFAVQLPHRAEAQSGPPEPGQTTFQRPGQGSGPPEPSQGQPSFSGPGQSPGYQQAGGKHSSHHGGAGAAIGGLILGEAIAAAISPRKKVVEKVYVPVGAPPPPPAQPYSPAAGVVCYPAQRACYTNGGGYDPRWTWQVYAK